MALALMRVFVVVGVGCAMCSRVFGQYDSTQRMSCQPHRLCALSSSYSHYLSHNQPRHNQVLPAGSLHTHVCSCTIVTKTHSVQS